MLWWFLDAEPELYANGNPLSPAWGKDWYACVVKNRNQNACTYISEPNMPNLQTWASVEVLSSLAGIMYFIAFGFNSEGWKRIVALITYRSISRSASDGAEKPMDSYELVAVKTEGAADAEQIN